MINSDLALLLGQCFHCLRQIHCPSSHWFGIRLILSRSYQDNMLWRQNLKRLSILFRDIRNLLRQCWLFCPAMHAMYPLSEPTSLSARWWSMLHARLICHGFSQALWIDCQEPLAIWWGIGDVLESSPVRWDNDSFDTGICDQVDDFSSIHLICLYLLSSGSRDLIWCPACRRDPSSCVRFFQMQFRWRSSEHELRILRLVNVSILLVDDPPIPRSWWPTPFRV